MTDKSHTRSSFLGGEWSPSAMGRTELPNYDTALSSSYNGYPLEEGAWTKRGGTILLGSTNRGRDGIVRTWYKATKNTDQGQLQAVQLELTYGPGISNGSALLSIWRWPYTNNAPIQTLAAPYTALNVVKNIQMVAVDNGVFFLSKFFTPWILQYDPAMDTFSFQDADFHKLDGPYLDPYPGASQTMNSLATTSSQGAGDVTITITDGAYSFTQTDVGRVFRGWSQPPVWDSGTSYTSGQVVTYDGNYWTVLQNPPAGNVPGTQAQIGSFIVVPWALVPQQGTWAYGWVKAVSSASVATITLITGWPNVGTGGDPGKNGFVLDTWQLGVYTDTQYPACGVWHEGRLWLAGALQGRIDASKANGLFTSAAIGGAIVGSHGGLGPIFSPTDQFGTVADNSGISETFNSDGSNMPIWMASEQAGILLGTAQAEWLIAASNLNDPLTPTSIQIHKITQYGSFWNTRPARVGIALSFIQTFGRRVMELVADVFSGRFVGRHLNEYAKHLTYNRFHELAYQEEPVPLIWARDGNGDLFSCTYRRVSHFGQEDPKFMGWSRHKMHRGTGVPSLVSSMSDTALSGQNENSQSSLVMLTGTLDPTGTLYQNCQLEIMAPITEASTDRAAWNSWHLDGAVSGTTGGILTISDAADPGKTMTITGVPPIYNGQMVSVFLCGLDFGDYKVFNGSIFVPFAADPDGLGTMAFMIKNYVPLALADFSFEEWTTGAFLSGYGDTWLPCVVGINYDKTQVQVTRPASRDVAEGKTGPGAGKTQRTHMWGGTFAQTCDNGLVVSAKQTTHGQEASGEVDPDIATPIVDFPVVFRYPNGSPIPVSTQFSGVFWDTISGDYNFDNQITLTSTRPVPLTIASLTGFLGIEDR